jgi:hypothetical protein
MGKNGIVIIWRWVCEYNLQINLNDLEQHIICDVSVIVCKICSVC